MIFNKNLVILLLLLNILSACHRNPLKVDISRVTVNLNIKHLDQDLKNVSQGNCLPAVGQLERKYGTFFGIYSHEILGIGNPGDSLFCYYLQTFLRDSVHTNPALRADSLFGYFKPYSSGLEQAFRYFRYYYPEMAVPQVVTYLSGFNQSIVTTPETLGISLDNYLGADCRFYRQLGIAVYKRRNMVPAKIVPDALYGWLSQQFEYKGETENLVSEMIYQGKLQYFLDALDPDGADSLKIGFTKSQLEWCRSHETDMWNYLVEKKLLFSGDRMEIVRFINSAPFTTPFGQKSPGRTGVWIGRQIVRSYLKKNPLVGLRGLMEENDYHKILNSSGYAPD